MAAVPKYKFVIEDIDGNVHEFERATDRAWELYENDVGRCQFFVPYNDLKLSSTSVRDDKFSEIRIYRDGILVWQGVLSYIEDTKDGALIFGETFLVFLKWYGTRYDQAHTTTAIGTIIGDAYDNIFSRTDSALAAKITKGSIEDPYDNGTTDSTTVTKTLYNNNYFDLLREMVGVARGQMLAGGISDWTQYTVFDISLHETTPTFSFKRDVGTTQDDVKFELESEILDFSIPRDFRSLYNEVKGFAIQEGPKVLTKTESEATTRPNFYRREAYPFFSLITNQDELDNKTAQFLRELKEPKRDMIIKFAPGLKPFDGYTMGDNVKLIINRGRVSISEYRRVVGMYVKIDETGVELTTPVLENLRS